MTQGDNAALFPAKLLRPVESDNEALWAFIMLPQEVSATLPRRGRTTVDGTLNGYSFQITLEPDGQLSHWLPLSKTLVENAGANVGDIVLIELMPVIAEPEPAIPADLATALAAHPMARSVWDETTTIARVDWIHWIVSAKQTKTRAKRINDACQMLASGKRRVCCFDTSGFYSKALSAPKAAD